MDQSTERPAQPVAPRTLGYACSENGERETMPVNRCISRGILEKGPSSLAALLCAGPCPMGRQQWWARCAWYLPRYG
eukprot:scaffold65870_cov35-Tisochrysis_lutea.AAC.2